MSIDITGAESIEDALNQLVLTVKDAMMPKFKDAASGTVNTAMDICSYDANHRGSGPHLRDTGRVEEIEDGYSATFGDTSGEYGYSWYVETGHKTRSGSFVPAQPYLMPASEKNAIDLIASLEDIV